MKNGSLLFLFLFLFACSEQELTKTVSSSLEADTKNEQTDHTKEDKAVDASFLNGLKAQKTELRLKRDRNDLMGEVWVKVSNTPKLVLVENEQWPDSVETTYILLKDRADHIKLVSEFPYSENGDWEVVYEHYFEDNGKTFAFERKTNFFDSTCSEGLVYEQIQEYYGVGFERLEREYSLRDESKNELKPSGCQMKYDFSYQVINHLEHYLRRINYNQ